MMNTYTLPNGTLQPADGMELGGSYQQFVLPPILRTEPANPDQCAPVTQCAGELTWSAQVWALLWRLADLYSTPENERWPNADWPSTAAFEDARHFTEKLPSPLKVLPHISLANDGEVNFAWTHGEMRIDLGFYGTGTFSYYARSNGGKEYFGDEIPADSRLPKDLVSLLLM